jgi:hypothetical protein
MYVLPLSTSYNIVSSILLSRLSPNIDEIIWDHHHYFHHNESSNDQTFCICQILKKEWEYIYTVYYLFVDFKKAKIQLGASIVQHSH